MTTLLDIDPSDLTGSNRGAWQARSQSIRVEGGPGSLDRLGLLVADAGARRPLVVTDRGLLEAGHVEHALQSLHRHGDVAVFDRVEENPTTAHVEDGAGFAREHDTDLIIALGGGSAMDCAKGINFLLTNGGKMEDYWGTGKASQPMLPSIGIPSTCGTGSEAQSYALITQLETHRKMACGDPKARFHSVILDPEVAATAPRSVAARTGMDALSHAVECLVTTRGTESSRALAARAWELLVEDYLPLLEHRSLPSVARMQLGAFLAGAAIEASMLGGAHAAANPLTARHRIVHGDAVGLMLPVVVRHNAETVDHLYRRIEPGGGKLLADKIEHLRRSAGLPQRLRDLDVTREELPELAQMATLEWTGKFNPRALDPNDFSALYEAAY